MISIKINFIDETKASIDLENLDLVAASISLKDREASTDIQISTTTPGLVLKPYWDKIKNVRPTSVKEVVIYDDGVKVFSMADLKDLVYSADFLSSLKEFITFGFAKEAN